MQGKASVKPHRVVPAQEAISPHAKVAPLLGKYGSLVQINPT